MQAITESTALKEILINSKSAVVSAIKAVVGIPVIGPALAVGAAAGTAALIANYARRENGGSVSAGVPYIVGEKRPEVFIPNQSGRIVPSVSQYNSQAGSSGGGAGANNVTPVIINIKAFDAKDVKQYLYENKAMIQNMVASGIKDNSNGLRTIVSSV
jgi:hypothetical protein